MSENHDEKETRRDWRVSAVLTSVWIVAMIFIVRGNTNIPTPMLVIATAFFVILIPAMNDLVRSIERSIGRKAETEDHL